MKYYHFRLADKRYLCSSSLDILFYMKKIMLIIIFFLITLLNSCAIAQDTVWDVKNPDFWVELEEKDKTLNNDKILQLDAQIELDINQQNYEIDLIDAIKTGLQNSSSYKISKYQKQYSDWEYMNKLSEFLPNLDYSFSLMDLKGEFLVGGILPRKVHETVYSSTFNVEWEIFNGKRIFDSIRLRNKQKEKKHTENYTREDLIYRISTAYYELLQRKFEIEIYKYNLFELQEQLKYNQALYDVGNGTRFDILRSQSEVEAAKSEVESAILKFKMAQTNLANIAGYPISSNLQPKDKIIHKLELVEEDVTPEVLYNQAISIREDVKAKENSIKALKAQRNANFGDVIPSLALTWQRAYVGTFSAGGRSNDTYGFSVVAPIGKNLGANTFTKYKMDNANFHIAQTELDKMKTQIMKNITDNYYSSKTNNEIIEAKNKQIISTKEGLRQAIGRMKIGEATYLDVINANKQKTDARIDLITSIVNYNKSQLNQLFEIGQMNIIEIENKYEKAKSKFSK